MDIIHKTINRLDLIYKQIEAASKSHKINYTYLNTLKLILNDSKLKNNDKYVKEFVDYYNNLLDELYNHCEKHSRSLNDKNKLHLVFVKQHFTTVKEGILKGAQGVL